MSHTGPIANERLRVKTAVMRADQLLAQGVDEEYEAEMEESRYFIVPESAEPGAIRLANLQHQIQAKAMKRLDDRENEKEEQRQKALLASGATRYSRLRKNAGPAKGSAQHRYQRLLELRHEAKIKLALRNEKKESGEEDFLRKQRLMLIKRNKDLIEQLTKPKRLEGVKPIGVANEEVWRRRKKNNMRSDELEQEDEDPAMAQFPLPKGRRLEKAQQRHETSLQAMEPEKAWWQVTRNGIAMDIRDVTPKSRELHKNIEMPWSEWKKKGRLSGKNRRLYGRSGVPDIFNGEYDLEPALQEEDKDASDWWLNFALGALAETKTATAAAEVAENVGKGRKFDSFVKKAERKIFHKYKQQIVRQSMLHESTKLQAYSPEKAVDDLYGDYDPDYYGLSPSPSASPRGRRGMKPETTLDETLRELEMPFEASANASRKFAWHSESSDSEDGDEAEATMSYRDDVSQPPFSQSRRLHRRNRPSRQELHSSMRMHRSGRRRPRQDGEDSMQMTWQERVPSVVAIVEIFRYPTEAVLGKAAAGGVPNVGLPGRNSESLRLPGSRNDGENPKLYLTEGKMGDRFDSRGRGRLLPSSAREDISTGRSDKTSISSKSNEKRIALCFA